MELKEWRRNLTGQLMEYHHAARSYRDTQTELVAQQLAASHAEQAQRILQEVAQTIQTAATRQIESVVTRCLRTVFGDEGYDFHIRFNRKRGKTEAELLFVRDGHELDPLTEAGGGVCDLAGLSLRLSCLLLRSPKPRMIIIADEAMKNIHGEVYRERAAQLLETLAHDLNLQIIQTTGFPWLEIGRIVKL